MSGTSAAAEAVADGRGVAVGSGVRGVSVAVGVTVIVGVRVAVGNSVPVDVGNGVQVGFCVGPLMGAVAVGNENSVGSAPTLCALMSRGVVTIIISTETRATIVSAIIATVTRL